MKTAGCQLMKKYFLSIIPLLFLLTSQYAIARSPGQDALDLGTSLYKQDKFKEAVDAYKLATQKDPALIKAWENLGWRTIKEAIRLNQNCR